MSILSLQNNISRSKKKITDLRTKLAKQQDIASKATKEIIQTKKSITKNTSATILKTKLARIGKAETAYQKALKEISSINSKMITEEKDLVRLEERLLKEQERETKKLSSLLLARESQTNNQQSIIQDEINKLKEVTASLLDKAEKSNEINEYDVFISHASEDKIDLVTALSNELETLGLKVFEDVKVFKLGDSLSQKINEGILNSKFGIVVLSPDFIRKAWTVYEFTGFLMREMNERNKVILPIWHNISKEEVAQFNPTLVDKFALDSANISIKEIAEMIAEIARPTEVFSSEEV